MWNISEGYHLVYFYYMLTLSLWLVPSADRCRVDNSFDEVTFALGVKLLVLLVSSFQELLLLASLLLALPFILLFLPILFYDRI